MAKAKLPVSAVLANFCPFVWKLLAPAPPPNPYFMDRGPLAVTLTAVSADARMVASSVVVIWALSITTDASVSAMPTATLSNASEVGIDVACALAVDHAVKFLASMMVVCSDCVPMLIFAMASALDTPANKLKFSMLERMFRT